MILIKKVVITAAGTGTRLLPATKEIAKEMLPLFARTKDGHPILKPTLQSIYQSLYNFGIRNYCFVVGSNRRSVEDHFSINHDIMKRIFVKKDKLLKKDISEFYHQLRTSRILYMQQQEPRGFGDAVLQSRNFVGDDDFILHAGDDLITSKNDHHLKRLNNCINNLGADVGLLIHKVQNPKSYGVVEIKNLQDNYFKVHSIEEKPSKPKSKFAIVGIYSFKPIILDYLKYQKPDNNNEIQLTTAIQDILHDGHKIIASKVLKEEVRVDIGTPENYAKSIIDSYKRSTIIKISK